ncbi:hypothetical protein [Chitinophaga caseinilytica]|uniref:Uncharacterized protein n=1 Tax=Chitinophaga caseinilytica TaxID=2267521 RepID=A0ABZ2ZB21_9BACT
MYYSNDEEEKRIRASQMERRRLLLYDRAYLRMFQKYWFINDGTRATAEDKRKYYELRANLEQELNEYTASEAFDPVLAKKLRACHRRWMKEDLEMGSWHEQRMKRLSENNIQV